MILLKAWSRLAGYSDGKIALGGRYVRGDGGRINLERPLLTGRLRWTAGGRETEMSTSGGRDDPGQGAWMKAEASIGPEYITKF